MDNRRSRKRTYSLMETINFIQGYLSSPSLQIVPSNNAVAPSTSAMMVPTFDSSFQMPAPRRPSASETKRRRTRTRRNTVAAKKANKPNPLTIRPETRPSDPAALVPPPPPPPRLGDCPICLEAVGTNGGAVCSTKCGHLFCDACLMKTLKIKRECPVCKKPLIGIGSYHRLYCT